MIVIPFTHNRHHTRGGERDYNGKTGQNDPTRSLHDSKQPKWLSIGLKACMPRPGILMIPDCVGKFSSTAVSPDCPLNAHLVDRRSTYARARMRNIHVL